MEILRTLHPYMAVALIAGYGTLAVRLFLRKKDQLGFFDRLLSQFARITLLLAYFSGLVMSMNLQIWVPKMHHYASLLPVGVLFLFQFIPQFLLKEMTIRGYAMMFLGMFISVVVISISSGFINI